MSITPTFHSLHGLYVYFLAHCHWVCATCGWAIPAESEAAPAMGVVSHDLRFKKALSGEGWTFHRYAQVFEQQHGFIPWCAILDALFVLGPQELSHRLDDLVTPPGT